MTKVAIKNENITSFGGIYHITDVFSKSGLKKFTESVLGKRGSSGKAFSHGSIFGFLFFSYPCGGECPEDINALIRQLKQRPDALLPGVDTVGHGLKELVEENIIYKSEASDKSYSFNTAEKLNTLLLRMIRGMGLIKAGGHVGLDSDRQFIPVHKFDTRYSYKQDSGYLPGRALIGGIIVGDENRDGNINVKLHQENTLRRIMDRVISELGVTIERFRADYGPLSKEIIQTVERCCSTPYIRVATYGSRCEDFNQLKEWKSIEVGYERCNITSISMDNLIEGRSYRLVVQRSPLKDKDGKQQTDMSGVTYTYRCTLTNNWISAEKDIITSYNECGASERNFGIQNNDFGWPYLPFSFTVENMVFMMVTATLKNFYLYLVHHISEKVKSLKKINRLKAFTLHFVSVLAK